VSRKTGGISDETGAKRQIFENQNKNKVKFLSKKLKAKLLHVIRGLARKISNINVIVKKVKPDPAIPTSNGDRNNTQDMQLEPVCEPTIPQSSHDSIEDNTNYQIKNVKERIVLTYSDTLNPKFFPWYMIKGFSNLSPYDLYRIYMTELVPDEYHFTKLILKKNFITNKKKQKSLSMKKKLRGIAAVSASTAASNMLNPVSQKVQEDEIFCYCRKPCNGEFMIGNCLKYLYQ
jgi:hypothetical protein